MTWIIGGGEKWFSVSKKKNIYIYLWNNNKKKKRWNVHSPKDNVVGDFAQTRACVRDREDVAWRAVLQDEADEFVGQIEKICHVSTWTGWRRWRATFTSRLKERPTVSKGRPPAGNNDDEGNRDDDDDDEKTTNTNTKKKKNTKREWRWWCWCGRNDSSSQKVFFFFFLVNGRVANTAHTHTLTQDTLTDRQTTTISSIFSLSDLFRQYTAMFWQSKWWRPGGWRQVALSNTNRRPQINGDYEKALSLSL